MPQHLSFRGWLHAEENPQITGVANIHDIEAIKKIQKILVCVSPDNEKSVRNVLYTYTAGGTKVLSLPMERRGGDLMLKIGVSTNGRGNIRDKFDTQLLSHAKTDFYKSLIGVELTFEVVIRPYTFTSGDGKSISGIRFILERIFLKN